MNKSYRAIIVMCFILFEIVYIFTLLANISAAPSYIVDNGEVILFSFIVFNMILISTLLF